MTQYTVGDVLSETGLGSISSLAVELLNALYASRGDVGCASQLAGQACSIEIDIVKSPIGRQDQYAAAFGSMNYIEFNSDHSVDVEPVPAMTDTLNEMKIRVLMFHTQINEMPMKFPSCIVRNRAKQKPLRRFV